MALAALLLSYITFFHFERHLLSKVSPVRMAWNDQNVHVCHLSHQKSHAWLKTNTLSAQEIYFPSERVKYLMHVDGIGKYIFRLFMGNRRQGGSRAESLSSLILEDTEVSGPFQTLTGGNMLSGWHCKCREFACLCVALPQGHRGTEEWGFSHQWTIRNRMVLIEILSSPGVM